MVAGRKESPEEKDSRLLFLKFLIEANNFLERVLDLITSQTLTFAAAGLHHLNVIAKSAKRKLKGVIDTVSIGLSLSRRKALEKVGMFGEDLKAKFALLVSDIDENAVRLVLRRLNSMLLSAAAVFPVLHAVKEYKDHLEIAIDGLDNPSEFISLFGVSKPR
jgi:hypothetical protein